MSKIKTIYILFLLTITISANATVHILSNLKPTINIFRAEDFSYLPGDTFCISAEEVIGGLRFIDFEGSPEQPLTIINCGGQTIIDEPTYSGISFMNCQYIRLTGTGSDDVYYGIFIRKTKSGTMGVAVGDLSSDVEIDRLEIANTGFAGIMAKTDPKCDQPETWRRNGFVLRNLHIHHNYIHHTGGEGMYIGFSGGYDVVSTVECNGDYVFGHWLENVNIHDNLVENAGWDGIQVSLTRSNCTIHHNKIVNYGKRYAKYQNFGMSLGSGNIQLYNNYIENQAPDNGASGLQMLSATSGSYLIGNVIVNTEGYGMFIHNRHLFDTNEGYYFINNTIVNPGHSADNPRSGIMYNTCTTTAENSDDVGNCQLDVQSIFMNNLIVNPGAHYENNNFWKKEPENYIDFNTKELRDANLANLGNNLFTRNMDTLHLINPALNDFQIANTNSPLYNAGANVSAYPMPNTDANGNLRFYGGHYDIGAYEYSEETEALGSNGLLLYPNPTNQQLIIEGDFETITELSVVNLSGKQLSHLVKITGQSPGRTTLDVSQLATGCYILKVLGKSRLIVKE